MNQRGRKLTRQVDISQMCTSPEQFMQRRDIIGPVNLGSDPFERAEIKDGASIQSLSFAERRNDTPIFDSSNPLLQVDWLRRKRARKGVVRTVNFRLDMVENR